ncbi:mitochondrial Rho GTPase 1-like isoform X3 [Tasmannia lanceolata]|uniref:mitochondrial Rho GTPase 1-like isoform X3 n=1 Tax=Tasmannia lanceolata TaxID=3420 RepID=UPI004063259A
MANSDATPNFGGRTSVRLVVLGDEGTGKSSLIATVAAESFPENVPSLLPPTRLPLDYFPDRVPLTIIDTSSSPENRSKLAAECRLADAVVLTYGCDQPATLDRLSTFWLPELRRLQVKVPIIVVGCKLDLRDDNQQVNLEQAMVPIMQQFLEIETCMECSSLNQIQVPEVFYYAQKAVLHPTAPLFDQETQILKPRCVSALKRIFILCDHDRDGALSDGELNDFQVRCFNAPLQPAEIVGVKRVVQEKSPEGFNEHGLTLTGFLFLHAMFIEKGRLETTWTMLRKFGYDNDLKLRDDLIPLNFKRAPDQSVELTNEAVEFLKAIFFMFDIDGWALMTLLDPASSLANLIYLGFAGDPASAFHITRRRRLDCKRQQSQRNVFQCYLFGPKKAGKSALLNSFIGKPFTGTYSETTYERFAANILDHLMDKPKETLILREIPEDGVKNLLSNNESLAACDIAVFAYDSSDENSWRKAMDLLVDVASHGENTGFGVPCLIVPTKDDLDPSPMALQHSTRVSQDMGIEAPITVSVKLGDLNNVFHRIISAAQHPHLSIPETEAGRNRKQYRRHVNCSLMVVSVGAAVAIVGLAAYRVYSTRKNASDLGITVSHQTASGSDL